MEGEKGEGMIGGERGRDDRGRKGGTSPSLLTIPPPPSFNSKCSIIQYILILPSSKQSPI